MRSLEESRTRWEASIKQDPEDLKRSVRSDDDDNPCRSGLRSVCWKTFLLFEGTTVTGWSRILLDSRSAYSSLKEHLLRFIENPEELGSALDPLDDDENSPWNNLRQDEEMRAEIFQDVERCMPDEPFFRQPEMQRLMLDILFVFCKINQDVGYRQGMHELLAPIVWVVEQDAIRLGGVHDQKLGLAGHSADSLMKQTLDAEYIEHDAFTLLSLIMRSAKSFYELGEPDQRSNTLSMGNGTPQNGASPIVERSKRIHMVYLAQLDPELAKHLTNIEVLPQIFLIRWIRLLFGREFPFDDLLTLWDTLLAEDPALDLVDMVCVAMLLRIRWQLIEANYSFALMLLLKYPSPSPYRPHTFMDDAIYLRDNFSAAGGAKIISKYSGKPPSLQSSGSRPSTPLGHGFSPKQKLSRTRSPLQSPSRFLQQQGRVEALFQGAAKGVLERGERLGINQAVRDAVGEVKKNMQGLHASRASSLPRSGSDVMRRSLDEGRSVPVSRALVSAMNQRNQQLARMLNDAMTDLRDTSVSKDSDKDKYVRAMDLAIARVDFVKVYLEDSTMPLPADSLQTATVSLPSTISGARSPSPQCLQAETPGLSTAPTPELGPKSTPMSSGQTQIPPSPTSDTILDTVELTMSSLLNVTPSTSSRKTESVPESEVEAVERPKAPVPTRSSIAQSSFSWMLEPDASGPGLKSSPPKSPSPFLKSGRRPASGVGREKAAFLFGDDGGESNIKSVKLPTLNDTEEVFNLGTIKGRKGK